MNRRKTTPKRNHRSAASAQLEADLKYAKELCDAYKKVKGTNKDLEIDILLAMCELLYDKPEPE